MTSAGMPDGTGREGTEPPDRIAVVIVDDHPVVRDGLRGMF